MQKVRIKEIQPSIEKEKPTVIVDDNGARMSGFDTKLRNLKVGDLIEAELEVKGKYINIKEWKLLEGSVGPTSIPSQQSSDNIQLQIDAQARIAALTIASQFYIAGKIESVEMEAVANKYYDWLLTARKVAPVAKSTVPAAKAGDDLERELFGGDRDPETIHTMGDLFTVCLEDFNLKPSEVVTELGYKNKEEIGESPADCYRIIARQRPPP